MKSVGIKKMVIAAQRRVMEEITGNAVRGGLYSGALASEGYAGGYRDALSDVLLALNGVRPNRRSYWAGDARGGNE